MSLKAAWLFTGLAVALVGLIGLSVLAEYHRSGQIIVHLGATAVAGTLVTITALIWLQRWRSRAPKPPTKKEA